MKSIDSFRTYYEANLLPVARELEDLRRQIMRLTGLVALCVLGAVGAVLAMTMIPLLGILLMIGMIALLIFPANKLNRIYRVWYTRFKQDIIGSTIRFIHPELKFDHKQGISREVFRGSRIFLQSLNKYKTDDLVWGKVDATDISFAEVHAIQVTKNKNSRTESTIFRGVFFMADFHKHFHEQTYVLPDMAERHLGVLGRFLQSMNIARPSAVRMEDTEFERFFSVYSTDQVEARYLLTPTLMEQLVSIRQRVGSDIGLSFIDSKVYLTMPERKPLLEPKFWKKMDSYDDLYIHFELLNRCIGLVEDLNLNTRIWTKE